MCCVCFCCPLQAVEELFNLMQLFVAQRADMREEELEDIKQFKKTTISCYLRCLDGRSCWTTLIRSAWRHDDNTETECRHSVILSDSWCCCCSSQCLQGSAGER